METGSTQTKPGVQVPSDGGCQRDLVAPTEKRKLGRRASRTSEVDPQTVLTVGERLRSRVLAGSLARLAARRPEVITIRRRLLGDRLLTSPTTYQIMGLPGLALFSSSWFRKHRIPIFDHRSYYLESRTVQEISSCEAAAHVVIEWGRKKKIVDLRRTRPVGRHLDEKIRNRGPVLPIKAGSVLWELLQVAKMLSRWYDWAEYDAVVFILDGTPPEMPTIAVDPNRDFSGLRTDHRHYLITLRIEPWVQADAVARAYRLIQRERTGKQVRTLDPKALRAFAFVEDYLDREFGSSSPGLRPFPMGVGENGAAFWGRLADDWNKKYGRKRGWSYTGRDLSRNFKRTHRAVLWPPFRTYWTVRKESAANQPSAKTDAGRTPPQRSEVGSVDRDSRSESRGRTTHSKRNQR